jgi:hypothetical protein
VDVLYADASFARPSLRWSRCNASSRVHAVLTHSDHDDVNLVVRTLPQVPSAAKTPSFNAFAGCRLNFQVDTNAGGALDKILTQINIYKSKIMYLHVQQAHIYVWPKVNSVVTVVLYNVPLFSLLTFHLINR